MIWMTEKEEKVTSVSHSNTPLGLSYVSAHPLSLSFPGISTLIAKGVYDSAFPLHDVSHVSCSCVAKHKKEKTEFY